MPLSREMTSLVKALNYNLSVFGEGEWETAVRQRLVDESVGVLDELIDDPVFNISLQFGWLVDRDASEVVEVLDGGAPLTHFLEGEELLLKHGGLEEHQARDLVQDVKRVLEEGLRGLVPPDEVFKSLIRLRLRLVETRDAKQHPDWIGVARKLAAGFGGGALICLNASGFATSIGISGPLSALSGAVGGSLLGESTKDAFEFLTG